MKKLKSTSTTFTLISMALMTQSPPALAMRGEGRLIAQEARMEAQRAAKPEIVRWIGTVKDDASTHTIEQEHELTFTRKDNGDSYDIVDSPEFAKLHHETGKNYLVEIEAEITSRFLFWGGNLVVKDFRAIEEANDRVPQGRTPAVAP